MSLAVWLPLTGDLHNQGLNQITATNNGATVDNNGKLGQCYSFDGSDDYLRFLYPALNLQGQWSFSCWVKINNITQNFTLLSSRKNTGMGLSIFILAGKIRFDNGSDSQMSQTSFTTSLAANVWQHVALVQTATERKFYLNGELKETFSGNAVSSGNTAQYMLIGGSSSADTTPNSNWLNGYLNDVRIYDHALSAKEVAEIAKGLILHYPLNDRFCEPTTNLVASSEAASYSYTTKEVAAYATSIVAKATYGNKIFTYSAYIKNTSDYSIAVRFNPYNANDSDYSAFNGNYIQPGQEGYSSVTVDITNTANWNGKAILYIQNGNPGTVPTNKTFYIKEVQLEEKNHATPFVKGSRISTTIFDTSGYSNNGTIVGDLAVVSPSPRYNVATEFNGSSYIKNFNMNIGNEWSYGFWIYSATSTRTWEGVLILNLNGGDSDMQLGMYTNPNSKTIQSTANGQYNSQISMTFGQWNYFFATFDGSNLKTYLNGTLVNTKAISNALLSRANLIIGGRNKGTIVDVPFVGKLSDIRIYATALTAAQVTELYNQSMIVDASGNVLPRELV